MPAVLAGVVLLVLAFPSVAQACTCAPRDMVEVRASLFRELERVPPNGRVLVSIKAPGRRPIFAEPPSSDPRPWVSLMLHDGRDLVPVHLQQVSAKAGLVWIVPDEPFSPGAHEVVLTYSRGDAKAPSEPRVVGGVTVTDTVLSAAPEWKGPSGGRLH